MGRSHQLHVAPGRASIVLAAVLLPAQIQAQQSDHTDRGDAADFREHEDGRPEPYEYDALGVPGPSWGFDVAVPLSLDVNPFWSSDGSQDALLAAPSLTVTYTHPQLLPGLDLELKGRADADIYSHDPSELNEARLIAAATLFHQLGDVGILSAGFQARWAFVGKGFGRFDQSQQRYMVTFAPNIPDGVWASAGLEYRDSSAAAQRRIIATANVDWTMVDNALVRLGLFQELAFSRFTAGANDGRRDLLSLSELLLTPNFDLPAGLRVGMAATLFHRFSNRRASRFTTVQIGPSVRIRF